MSAFTSKYSSKEFTNGCEAAGWHPQDIYFLEKAYHMAYWSENKNIAKELDELLEKALGTNGGDLEARNALFKELTQKATHYAESDPAFRSYSVDTQALKSAETLSAEAFAERKEKEAQKKEESFQHSKRLFKDMVCKRVGWFKDLDRQAADALLDDMYEAKRNFPADHAYNKLLNDLSDGKAHTHVKFDVGGRGPYTRIQSRDMAKEALQILEGSEYKEDPAVKKAIESITAKLPSLNELAGKEKEEQPEMERFAQITEEQRTRMAQLGKKLTDKAKTFDMSDPKGSDMSLAAGCLKDAVKATENGIVYFHTGFDPEALINLDNYLPKVLQGMDSNDPLRAEVFEVLGMVNGQKAREIVSKLPDNDQFVLTEREKYLYDPKQAKELRELSAMFNTKKTGFFGSNKDTGIYTTAKEAMQNYLNAVETHKQVLEKEKDGYLQGSKDAAKAIRESRKNLEKLETDMKLAMRAYAVHASGGKDDVMGSKTIDAVWKSAGAARYASSTGFLEFFEKADALGKDSERKSLDNSQIRETNYRTLYSREMEKLNKEQITERDKIAAAANAQKRMNKKVKLDNRYDKLL